MAVQYKKVTQARATGTGKPSKPGPVKYRNPLQRGVAQIPPKDRGDGNFELTNYGRVGFGGAEGVAQSDSLSDLDISADDPVKAAIVKAGADQTADLYRKIDPTKNAPVHTQMKGASKGATVPQKIGVSDARSMSSTSGPVRKPGRSAR